jgi:tight adherence protein B
MEETPLPGSRGGARWRALAVALEQADMSLTPGALVRRTALGAAGAAAAFWAIAGIPGALVAAALVPIAVRAHLKRRVRKRRRAFSDQLADTVQAIAGAMRAGHGLSSAVAMIAEDAAEPMASELRRIVGAERLGVPLDEALDDAVRRTGNSDLEQLALVAVLQREVGGNAAEALDRIVDTIRHRDEVKRLVQTLTAQGQLSRWVLTAMPIALGAIMMSVGGGYMRPMFHTTTGLALIVGSGVMIVVGSLWIRQIIEVEV